MQNILKIIRPGMHTTVQDGGRSGWRQLGISCAGALDLPALHLANLLVGNDENAAALEITLGQFSAEFTQAGWFALTGADCSATLDGQVLHPFWRYLAKAGQKLTLKAPQHGVRSYLALAGGIDVPLMMGSRSTDLKAGFGGHQGRSLQKGDALALGAALRWPNKSIGIQAMPHSNRVRAIAGPELHVFDAQAQQAFWHSGWKISAQSNRMGYRLTGPGLSRACGGSMLSHGVLPGVVQVPDSGEPIILMSDAQTTGGYPRIACVIEADMHHLAQIMLGDLVYFVPCSVEEALHAKLQQRHFLQQTKWLLQNSFDKYEN